MTQDFQMQTQLLEGKGFMPAGVFKPSKLDEMPMEVSFSLRAAAVANRLSGAGE